MELLNKMEALTPAASGFGGRNLLPWMAGPRIRPAKVRLNFRLGRRNSGPFSANCPDVEYGCPSGAAAIDPNKCKEFGI